MGENQICIKKKYIRRKSMSNLIVLNSENYSNGKFTYRFPSAQTFRKGDLIGVQSVSLYNSFFNVESARGNTIQIDWPSSASDWVSVTVTLDDGFYDASAMNSKIQQACFDNKMYLDGDNGTIKYYIALGTSSTQYANMLTTYSVPLDTAPPTGATWLQLTGTQRSPRIFFKTIGPLYGFPAESTATTSYGYTQDTSLVTYSLITPQVNPFNSVVFTCNLVNNGGLAFPTNFLYSIGLNNGFGELVSSDKVEILYNNVQQGTYNDIEIKLHTNTLDSLALLDTNALILLSIIKKN